MGRPVWVRGAGVVSNGDVGRTLTFHSESDGKPLNTGTGEGHDPMYLLKHSTLVAVRSPSGRGVGQEAGGPSGWLLQGPRAERAVRLGRGGSSGGDGKL